MMDDAPPRFDLIPPNANAALGRFFEREEQLNGRLAWEKGIPVSKLITEIKAHLWAFETGRDLCASSGLSPLTHVIGLATILSEQMFFSPEFDDRFSSHKPLRVAIDICLYYRECLRGYVPTVEPFVFFSFYQESADVRAWLDEMGHKHIPLLIAQNPAELVTLLTPLEAKIVITWDSWAWITLKQLSEKTLTPVLISQDREMQTLHNVFGALGETPWLKRRTN